MAFLVGQDLVALLMGLSPEAAPRRAGLPADPAQEFSQLLAGQAPEIPAPPAPALPASGSGRLPPATAWPWETLAAAAEEADALAGAFHLPSMLPEGWDGERDEVPWPEAAASGAASPDMPEPGAAPWQPLVQPPIPAIADPMSPVPISAALPHAAIPAKPAMAEEMPAEAASQPSPAADFQGDDGGPVQATGAASGAAATLLLATGAERRHEGRWESGLTAATLRPERDFDPLEPKASLPRPPEAASAAPVAALAGEAPGGGQVSGTTPGPGAAEPAPTPLLPAATLPESRGEAPRHTVPAAPPTPRPSPMAEAGHQIALRAARAAAQGVESISVDLRPPELGRVELRLTFQDGSVQVALAAERADTFEAFRQDRANLELQMQQAGLQLGGGGLDLQHGRLPREAPEQPRSAIPANTGEAPAEEATHAPRPPSDSLIDLIA
ncbi:flagellar hook-length control protein FliK [Roseomonas marmotae]|uniref:Flagellar hook-length control protein FliK n=1 Tax=Roseomonas marmotae TaxID=2768161 RepID=A0ABS3KF71_9PROT|nr:flagellar hook-length control protein FliK [Roseomonas marmotae]MBO1076124.1 flagellar hook-length control protein FliK [Roseomonas marmotae]QTI81258.1 flagellar hook-length control protein FliK [Roseomonas marmotae]